MKQDIDRSSKKSYLSTFVFDDLVIKKNIFIAIFLSVHQVSICFAKIENVGAL